jgi:putative metalloprotease
VAFSNARPHIHTMATLLKLLPILLIVGYALAIWRGSRWRLEKELSSKSTPLDDVEVAAKIKRLGAAVDLPALSARVYEIEPINGLASPDGRIFITRGLLNWRRSGLFTADEIAAVIAHELGHIALGHHQRRMAVWAAQNAARVAIIMLLARFVPIIGILIANLLGGLFTAQMSQADEFEADAYATALLIRSGLDPTAQLRILRKLARMGTGAASGPAWLMSHPATDKRVRRIEELIDKWTGDAVEERTDLA